MWADLAAEAGDWVEAGQAWDQVLDLLPLLVGRSLDQRDRQHHLSMWAGFGPQAATAAMRTGDLGRAWQVLEQGRGVLLRDAWGAEPIRGFVGDIRAWPSGPISSAPCWTWTLSRGSRVR